MSEGQQYPVVGKEGNRRLLPTSFADIDELAAEMGKEEFRAYVDRVYAAVLRHPPYVPLDIESKCTPETKKRFISVLWLYLVEGHGGYLDNDIKRFTKYDDAPVAEVRRRLLARKSRINADERTRAQAEAQRDRHKAENTPNANNHTGSGAGSGEPSTLDR